MSDMRTGLARTEGWPGRLSLDVAGHPIALSHPGRILMPAETHSGGQPVTRADLLKYYLAVADVMLPHLRERPLTLTRYPEGITGKGFFQKNRPPRTPTWVRGYRAGSTDYLLAQGPADLAFLASLSAIEIHTSLSRVDRGLRPDLFVIDLDPMPPAGWPEVQKAARAIRALLRRLAMEGYPKTSGATGLHVYVPISGSPQPQETTAWARAIGILLTQVDPSLFTVAWSVAKRHGIYVDYGQNAASHTMAAVYSVRALAGGPVSTPLTWEEVDHVTPRDFTIWNMPMRLERYGDLFGPTLGPGQDPTPLANLAAELHVVPRHGR